MPKLVFEGIEPNSPEAAALARLLDPQIRLFYQVKAAGHAAGIVDQSKGQRSFGGLLHMQYINQGGNETVRVKVAPEAIGKLMQPKVPPLAEGALVEIYVPDTYDSSNVIFSWVFITVPLLEEIEPGTIGTITGTAGSKNGPHKFNFSPTWDRRPVQRPFIAQHYATDAPAGHTYASYLLDFRGMGPIRFVGLELNTALGVEIITPTLGLWYTTYPVAYTSGGVHPSYLGVHNLLQDETPGGDHYFSNSTLWTGLPGEPSPPTASYSQDQGVWLFDDTASKRAAPVFEYTLPGGTVQDGLLIERYDYWTEWFAATGPQLGYVGPDPLPAELRVTVLSSVSEMFILDVTQPGFLQSYERWVYPDFPEVGTRPAPRTFNFPIPVSDPDAILTGTLDVRYNIPRNGTLTFDRQLVDATYQADVEE